VFGACLLSFMMLITPIASVAAATLRAAAPPAAKAATKQLTADERLEAPLFEPASALPPVPVVTATKTDTFPVHPSGQAQPGDQITYDVAINNASSDATNTIFTDTIDPNTTLVPGSLKVSPVAAADSYVAEQSVALVVGAPGVLTNDYGTPAPTVGGIVGCLDVTAPFTCTTTGGGTVVLAADGSYTYTPLGAFTGADTFIYTSTNSAAGGLAPDDTATVTITVDARPTVTSTTPTNGATGVATSPNIVVNFSEPVTASTSSFTIECPAPGNLKTFTVSGSGTSTITLDPTVDLPAATTCTVTVIANQISDVDSNDPPDNMATDYVFSFTTDAPPTVTTTTPTNGATGVATSSNIIVNFSEPVTATTSSFTIECPAPGNLKTYTVSGSGTSTITLDPTVDLPTATLCSVTVIANQIADTDTNDPPNNMTASYVFSFTTDAAPSVTSTVPTDTATGVPTNSNITVNFSEPVNATTASFSLECPVTVPKTFTVSGSGTSTITLDPTVDLPIGTICRVTVIASQISDTDSADPPDNMAANYVFNFTTDFAPTVSSTVPTNGATTVATNTNITINFSEPVTASTSSFTIECPNPGNLQAFTVSGSGTSTITLDPAADLPVGTICTVTVIANQISDTDANDPPDNMVANFVFSFTTDSPPSVSTTTPTNGATGVAANTNVTINFSEAVSATTSSFTIECPTPGNLQAYAVSGSGTSTITLNPTADLPPGTICTVTVIANQVSDTDAGDPPDNMTANYVFSFSVPPVAVNDAYAPSIVGNVGVNTDNVTEFSILTNDTPSSGVTINQGGTSTQGGSVVVDASNGKFMYTPPVGYEGADSFTYTISNASGTSNSATVSFTVAGMIWFINSAAGAGNGRLATPFNTVAAFQAVNTNLGGATAGNGDNIFIYENAASYTGPLNLLANQKLIGQDATATLAAISGVSVPADSFPLPNMNTGAPATTVNSASAGVNAVRLCALTCGGQTNTIRGLFITTSNATAKGIEGISFGTLSLSEVSVSGTGQALNLDTGALAATFGIISSTGGTNNINLNSITGSMTNGPGPSPIGVGGGFLSGATGDAFKVTGGTANITWLGHIFSGSAHSVNITSKTAGTVTFQGSIDDTDTGILLSSNTGATVSFQAALNLSTGASTAFSATGGGTVNVLSVAADGLDNTGNGTTDAADEYNTLTTTTGTALNVANTTIGASGLTFRSISSNGAANGITLNTTGALGGLKVEGDPGSTNNNSGGTIQNTTSHGISLTSTQDVMLDQMNIQSTAASGINGTTVTNFTFTNGTVNNSGNANGESNIAFNGSGTLTGNNISGTLTVTNSTLTNAFDSGLDVQSNAGTISHAIVTGNTITSTTSTATSKGHGINFVGTGNASTTHSLTRATITGNTVRNFPSNGGIQINYGNTSGGPLATAGIPGDATNIISITGNTVRGNSAANRFGTSAIILSMNSNISGQRGRMNFDVSNNGTVAEPVGDSLGTVILIGNNGYSTMVGTLNNNVLIGNNTVASPGIGGGNGIVLSSAETPDLTLTVTNNNISLTDGNGILLVGRGVTGIAKLSIKTNTVAAPLTGFRPGIRVDAGNNSSVDDAVCVDISGNTSGGSGGAPGIGLRKEDLVATTNDFGIEGFGGGNCSAAENFVAGLNPGSVTSTLAACDGFTVGKRVLVIAGDNFVSCSSAPLLFSAGSAKPYDAWLSTVFNTGSCANTSDPTYARALGIGAWSTPNSLTAVGYDNSLAMPLSGSISYSLSQQQLDLVASAAIERWSATGLTKEQVAALHALTFEISNLQGKYLGEARGNRILVDSDAESQGWFVDPGPLSDTSFSRSVSASRFYTDPFGVPAGHVDLLTAIMHEMGHKLGLSDSYAEKDRDNLMFGYLTVGERRFAARGQAGSAKPGTLKGSHFLSLSTDEKQRQAVTKKHSTTTLAKPAGAATTFAPVVNPACGVGTIAICLGTLRTARTVNIQFKVAVNTPFPSNQVSNQGSVAFDGGGPVLTDDPSVVGASDQTVTPVQTCSAPPVPGNMVAWWSGDDTPRDIAAGNNGTLNGGMGYAAGKVLNGFSLDGTDDYVSAPDSVGLSPTGAVTIDAWVNPDTLVADANGRTIVSKYDSATAGESSYLLRMINGGQILFAVYGPGGEIRSVLTPGSISTGLFTHVAATFDASTDVLKIYLNGADTAAPVVGGSTLITSISDSTTPVRIGALKEGASLGGFFDGVIDEVEIFNVVLTPAQVLDIYSADAGGKCKPSDLKVTKSHVGNFNQNSTGNTYTITVHNDGPATTSGTTTVTDMLPAGLTATAMSGSGWTCPGPFPAPPASPTFSCTSTATIASGADFPAITLTVDAGVNIATAINQVAVSGGGEMDTSDDTASDSTTLTPVADLSITKTDGQPSEVPGTSVNYTIVVTNNGPSNVTGATVTDTFPATITSVSYTSVTSGGATGNTAAGAGNISDTVNMPTGSTITYTVSGTINPSATVSVSNTATVAAPGGTTDPNPGNNSATDTDTLTTTADLSITKTDGSPDEVPGTSVTYTITVTNAGPSNVIGATVGDTFPATITGVTYTSVTSGGATGNTAAGAGNISDTVNMPTGSTVTYTATGTISPSATVSVSNTATVTAPGGVTDPNPGNNSATDTDTLTTTADLQITKTDGVASEVPGTSVTYTITVTNAGPSDVTGATVGDTFPATITGVTYTSVTSGGATGNTAAGAGNISDTVNMPTGSTITYTATGTISPSATVSLSNTATVAAPGGTTDPNPGNDSATDTDTLITTADLQITKTDGVPSEVPGTSVTYTITVTNAGPSNVIGATVGDTFPATITGVTYTSVTSGGATGNTAAGAGNISDTVNMPSGSTITYTATGTISPSATVSVSNTATVTAPGGVIDPNPGNNSATDTDTLTTTADLSITKTDGVASKVAGTTVTYTIVVSNAGPSDVTGATVGDTFPATITGVTYTSVTSGGATGNTAAGAGNISDTVNMPSGSSITYTATGTISPSATVSVSNTATVTAPGGVIDPNPGNNSATDTDTLTASADLLVTKIDSPDPVVVGTDLTYTITVTNNGSSDALNMQLSDTLPPNTTFVSFTVAGGWTRTDVVPVGGTGTVTATAPTLAAGASAVFTLVVNVNLGTPHNTVLTNSATVTTTTTDPNLVNNTGTTTTTVNSTLALTVNDSGDAADNNLGDRICDTSAAAGDQCTLRAAIQETNAAVTADTIGFSLPANTTITLLSALDDINGDLVITGPASGVTVNGNNLNRVFKVLAGKTVSILNLTMANGRANQGGGIFNSGNLTISNSTISGNNAVGGTAEGGAIYSNSGTLTILNSTISGNMANGSGGGLFNTGTSTATLVNVTVTNNRTDADGAAPGPGGGIAQSSSNPVTLRNTIVAGNFTGVAPGTAPDEISGNMAASSNNNLIGAAGFGGLTNGVNLNQVGVADARLAALGNNGGPTQTHALLAGSVALDAGDNTTATNAGLTTDQRGPGFARSTDGPDADATATVDIGAFEAQVWVQDILDRSIAEDSSDSFSFNVGGAAAITTVTATSSNTGLVPNNPANLSVSGSGSTRTLTITPLADQNGSTVITVTVNSASGSMSDTFVFTVWEVNDAPTANNDTIANSAEDSGPRTILASTLTANDSKGPANESGQTLIIKTVGSPVGGTVSIVSGNVVFTPTADYNGPASFQYTVEDNGPTNGAADPKTSGPATVNFNITEVNDAPDAVDDGLSSVAEDSAMRTIPIASLLANDTKGPANESGQTLTLTGVSNPVGGSVSRDATNVYFTPAADFNGVASFQYTVTDDGTTNGASDPKSDTATVSFTVTEVNDVPVPFNDGLGDMAEDAPQRTIPFSVLTNNDSRGAANESGQTLIVKTVSNPIGLTISIVAGTVRFTPLPNYNGPASFKYTVEDNGTTNGVADPKVSATSALAHFNITEVNDAPAAINDTLPNIAEDSGPQTIPFATLTGNDSKGPANESGQTLIVKTVGNAVGGTVSIAGGNVLFTPTADYNGPASFQYTDEDNGTTNGLADPLSSGMATVSFTITEVNDGPTANNDTLPNITEDSGPLTISFATLTANDSKGPANESGQTLTVKTVGNAVGGTVSIVAGNVVFTPTANFNGVSSFDYTVEDNGTTNGVADPKTSGTATVSFANSAVADTPSVTNATTNANTQTTSGLVISRNPADGAEVTHFKITGITGGLLFKNNGTTPINNGDFITFAEGNAGLKFTPGTVNGSFLVQASLSASNAGLGGGIVQATIIINPLGGVIRFSAADYSVAEGAGFRVITVERSGDTSQAVTVDYASSDHSTPADFVPCTAPGAGQASSRCDFTTAIGTLRFAAGETSKTFIVLISNDNYVEGPETLSLTLSNPSGGAVFGVPQTATLTIVDDASEGATNPIDISSFFVTAHYHDFLKREPDAAGLAFWTDNIEKCNDSNRRPAGQTAAQCIDKQRESTAIAFFMSPEFQMTGGFVYHLYKGSLTEAPNYDGGSLGRFPTFLEFMHDVSQVSEGIVVNNQISGAVVEANRNALAAEFVLRPEFVAKYGGLNDTLYVQELFNTTGIAATAAQKQALVDGLANHTETRASVLRKVVDGTVVISEGNVQFTTPYGQAFINQENRRLFVYLEYIGYLRRNPDTAGFVFWLGKLNFFNGDAFQAEMVRSFILSPEYRSRFGQP
jgi:uncharacterized repeat protein (TIGR01451 family)